MKNAESIAHALSLTESSAASMLKVLLKSHRPFAHGKVKTEPLVILGNGPALRPLLDSHMSELAGMDTLAVNFAANAPEFFLLKPKMYILADPHFFNPESGDANVETLWSNIASAGWPMTIYLPHNASIPVTLGAQTRLKHFNLTPGEGLKPIIHKLYNLGLAMPRPRNVLIPAIMTALREGYRRIYLAGADHSWSRTLSVDDDNHVISVQPHFYSDDKKEQTRVNNEYAGIRLHQIYQSLATAFASYHQIREYADTLGACIVNITPGSFIDAFPRMLPENLFSGGN